MEFQRVYIPLAAVAGVTAAYRAYGWPGVAAATAVLVMWILLHFTRMMQVLKRSASRPIGYVDSAVMLNAKLRTGATLLHVIAMTRALGAGEESQQAKVEVFRWTDGTQSYVRCEFHSGRLKKWQLVRPQVDDVGAAASSVCQDP